MASRSVQPFLHVVFQDLDRQADCATPAVTIGRMYDAMWHKNILYDVEHSAVSV